MCIQNQKFIITNLILKLCIGHELGKNVYIKKINGLYVDVNNNNI